MKTIQEIQEFINKAYGINACAKNYCLELLNSSEFPTHSVEFDWEDDDAPSVASVHFAEDITDAYITKLYIASNGLLMANLHAYYKGKEIKSVDLNDEYDVNYIEVLEYINAKRGNNKGSKELQHLIVNASAGEVMLKQQDNNMYVDVYIGENFDNYVGEFRGNLLTDTVAYLTSAASNLFND